MKVAVIGGGVSGLTSLKSCIEEGIEAVCFEMSSQFGGLWSEHEPAIGVSSAYNHLIVNTSKEMVALSDHPMPGEWPTYPTKDMISSYFRSYSERFDLERHIKLRHRVTKLEKTSDHEQTGCWNVTVENLDEADVKPTTLRFDAVVLCTGVNAYPNMPSIPDQEKFRGKVTHCHMYTSHKDYGRRDRIMVLGNAHSGCDIATDLCKRGQQSASSLEVGETEITEESKQEATQSSSDAVNFTYPPVYLSARSGVYVLKRNYVNPVDFSLSLFTAWLSSTFPSLYLVVMRRILLANRFDYEKYNMPPPQFGKDRRVAIFNDDMFDCLEGGKLKAVPMISRFTETGVVLSDGQSIALDTVVMATGYKIKLPFVGADVLDPNDWSLFKHVWPVNQPRNTLAAVGFLRALGPNLALLEMQARWVVQVFKGAAKLPPPDVMKAESKTYTADSADNFSRHIDVPYLDYITDIARRVGCYPSFGEFWTQPLRWLRIYFGPAHPYIYRLTGPGKRPEAWGLILSAKSRVHSSQSLLNSRESRLNNALTVRGVVMWIGFLLFLTYLFGSKSWKAVVVGWGYIQNALQYAMNLFHRT